MKGKFLVQNAEQRESCFLIGSVITGQLMVGMEARTESGMIIIDQLFHADTNEPLSGSVRKGGRVVIRSHDALGIDCKTLEGVLIEFSDARSIPLKKDFMLRPELG